MSSRYSNYLIVSFSIAWNSLTSLNLHHNHNLNINPLLLHKVLLTLFPPQLNLHSLNPLHLKPLLPFLISFIILFLIKFWHYKPNNSLRWPLSLHYSTINPYLWSISWILNPHNWKYWITSRPIFHHLLLPDPTYDAHGIGIFGVTTHGFKVLTLFHRFYVYPTCVPLCWLLSYVFLFSFAMSFFYDSLCFLFSFVIIDTLCSTNYGCAFILWLSVCDFVICDISLFLVMTKGEKIYGLYMYAYLFFVFLDICLMQGENLYMNIYIFVIHILCRGNLCTQLVIIKRVENVGT